MQIVSSIQLHKFKTVAKNYMKCGIPVKYHQMMYRELITYFHYFLLFSFYLLIYLFINKIMPQFKFLDGIIPRASIKPLVLNVD